MKKNTHHIKSSEKEVVETCMGKDGRKNKRLREAKYAPIGAMREKERSRCSSGSRIERKARTMKETVLSSVDRTTTEGCKEGKQIPDNNSQSPESIDFVIAVRNRENIRIQRCIDSFKKYAINIFVVDYGSKKPVKVKNATIIRYDKSRIWNKSHALNLGIKQCTSNYICTIDCDILLNEELIKEIIKNLSTTNAIFNTNVLRVDMCNYSNDYNDMLSKSRLWFSENIRSNLYSAANGGIQVLPREWLYKIGGYDEGLGLYWGAMDNRIYEQAKLENMSIIDLNIPMLHMEHTNTKESQLPPEEVEFANYVRAYKIQYLRKLIEENSILSFRSWGGDYPNHDWMINLVSEWKKTVMIKPRVYLALICNYNQLPTYFVMNLLDIINDAQSKGINLSVNNIKAPAVDSIRNYSVQSAKKEKCTHILQLDTDHLYPADVVSRLLRWDKDFVCGITTRKIQPFTQTQFKRVDVPKVNSPENICKFEGTEGLVEIGGTGMVGSLMKMNIFEKIDFPYYARNYWMDERKNIVETGEDIFFCRQLKKAGIKLYCDTSLSYPHELPNAFADKGEVILV